MRWLECHLLLWFSVVVCLLGRVILCSIMRLQCCVQQACTAAAVVGGEQQDCVMFWLQPAALSLRWVHDHCFAVFVCHALIIDMSLDGRLYYGLATRVSHYM